MRRADLLAAMLLAAAPCAAQPAARPSLVVLITVDQLTPEYFTRWPGQLTGGLHRLYTGGAVFTGAYQDHAMTETAPGHASLLSGRFPRSTGIVRNAAGVQDPQAPVLGDPRAPGASPFRFRGGTLVDWMRVADPDSRALSVSRKDRGAILPLGRAKQPTFWFATDGRFSTSTYYADTLPTWVRRFNERRTVQRLAGQRWTLLLPESAYPEPDSVPIERGGSEFTFPHLVPADSAGAVVEIGYTPWMDQMTLDLALEGVRAMELGAGPATDLLAVSLSATDFIGHRYGPDSREVHDHVLRLDRMLGVFMDSLAALRGADRIVYALSADHGVTRYPEVADPTRAAERYLSRAAFTRWLGEAARRVGVDSSAVLMQGNVVYYDAEPFVARGLDPQGVLTEFVAFAREQPGILRADLVAALPRDSATDVIARRWLRMFPPDLPAGAVVTQDVGHVWGRAGSGTAYHGSVHDDDAHVPLIFYGAGIRPGRNDGRARTVDLGPTLAALLGVHPTEPLDGRVLREALR